MTQYIKRIIPASLFCMLSVTLFGSPVAANANAGATDKPLTRIFPAQYLPKKEGVNLFNIGKLTAPRVFKGIAQPPKTESLVELKTIIDGHPVNFLVRRTNLSPERRKGLRALTHTHRAFLEQLSKRLGNSNSIITTFYTQHPDISDVWTAVGSAADHEKNGTEFDAIFYPNGLVVVRINEKQTLLFGIGEKTAQELISIKDGKGTIEIGNGRTIDAEQLAKSAI